MKSITPVFLTTGLGLAYVRSQLKHRSPYCDFLWKSEVFLKTRQWQEEVLFQLNFTVQLMLSFTDFATLWPQPNCPGQCQTWLSQLGPRSGIIITLYQPPAPPSPRCTCFYWLYLSQFLTDWPEILHDESLSGKDQVYGQYIDPAALQYHMQRCRTSKH